VSGDVHAGFCERRRVRLPPATHLIVGTESPRAFFWILKPSGKGFAEIQLRDNLPAGTSLEQAIFVS
jgi:hypothetical protein